MLMTTLMQAVPTAPPDLAALWPMFGTVLALAWAYGSRKLSSDDGLLKGFFHTGWGHGVITLVGSIIGAVVPVIQHGPTWAALAWAALGAGSAFFGALNPSVDGSNVSKLPDPSQDVIKGAFVAPKMLLPFLLIGVLGASACGPAGKKIAIDVAACAVGQVPAAVTGIIPDVTDALEGAGVDWASSLETIGIKAGIDAVVCAVKAIVGGYQARAARGELSTKMVLAMTRGQLFLQAHGVK